MGQEKSNNGSKFTVLSVNTQRSWKNAQDEWSSKTEWHCVCIFCPRLAEHVATAIKKGAHVLIEGELVSSTYEQPNGKGKKANAAKVTLWSIRADVVRKLDRGEPLHSMMVYRHSTSSGPCGGSDNDSGWHLCYGKRQNGNEPLMPPQGLA